MAAFNDLIDRFVRWFFNSSPTSTLIESHPATEPRNLLLRHGVVGATVVAALVLLIVFYSVVAGAVDRAAERRSAAPAEASRLAHR